MNNLKKDIIKIIIKKYKFKNQKCKEPCHKMKNLNCFFCYCPWYESNKKEGSCKINNPLNKGKWFYRKNETKIWDCSECIYPHQEKIVKEFLNEIIPKLGIKILE